MDLWVVAGAAAAGYIAKYWQNLSLDRDSLSELSSQGSNFEKPDLPSCPIRRLIWRKKLEKDISTDKRKILDQKCEDIHEHVCGSAVEVASTSEFDGEKLESVQNYANIDFLSVSSLPSGIYPSENLKGNECDCGLGIDIGNNYQYPSGNEMGSFHGSARKKCSLGTKHSYPHLIKPLNSLESCLMAQVYQKRTKMEEYVLSSIPSPSTPTIRQLFVTDGCRIISRANTEFRNARILADDYKLCKEACLEKNENLLGVPQLPQIGSLDFPKKMKLKSGKGRFGRFSISSKYNDGSSFHSQHGSQDAKVLYCLGISIGIIFSFIANRREVDKLKELLKQTKNLVQDLQEELEMKDSLTVKELANENNESLATCDNSFNDSMLKHFCPEQNIDDLAKHDDRKLCDDKAEESVESMSKIEAELEAELERMGLNMNSSSLERRLPDFVELDPDFEADFAQGELRASVIKRDEPDSSQDASATSTPHSANYAVSPRELSLRLHEVIESRLEERIKELKTALENSQRKVQLMEPEHKNSWRKFSNSPLRYCSDQESEEEFNSLAEPLVMNLSGEALDAYNEACEEMMKINELEEDSPSGDYENNSQGSSHPFDQSVSWDPNGATNGFSPNTVENEDKIPNDFRSSQRITSEAHCSRDQELLDVGTSRDENSDCEEEMEKQLIKQIVEITKRGSPVLLNAQKFLFLMDEDKP